MTRSYRPVDLSKLRTCSISQRSHKVDAGRTVTLPGAGASAAELLESLPEFLGAASFKRVVEAIVLAAVNDRPVVAALGAHVIKVGCGPVIADLIERGIIRAIAANGATAIHDFELASFGQTSEEVADTIRDGSFGMVHETMEFFDAAVANARRHAVGLGAAVGQLLIDREVPNGSGSIFVAARKAGIPACVHVAVGTDTIHVSPGLDGAALGEATLHDFRLLCDVVADLGAKDGSGAGGIWLNIGSAVVMPEVFLKAVAVARNLGADLDQMTTANFDMIRHYRPHQNVVTRPVIEGRGFEITGHHEIMLPLLRQAVIEKLAAARQP